MNIRTTYLKTLFAPELLKNAVHNTLVLGEQLKMELGFDTIVCSGTSGLAMGFILAHALGLPVLCVRKKNDGSHYSTYQPSSLEGYLGVNRYLIVDDFIATGATVNYIIRSIEEELPQAECVAMLMYTQATNTSHRHPIENTEIKVVTSRYD